MTEVVGMHIDGDTVADGTETYERRHPATGETVGVYIDGDASHVERAVAAARRAYAEDGWSRTTGAARAQVLLGLAERLRDRAEDYARLESDHVGIPYGQISWLNHYCADVVDFYAGAARMRFGRSMELSKDRLGLTLRQPVGVVGVITPWNFPLVLTIWKVAAALAAGCSLVIKPDRQAPATIIELARDLSDAGLPPGVCNVVTGRGAVVGEALVDHPDVDKIAFTGSNATGQRIMQRAAATMKRTSLELGGKSPLIIAEDADPQAAASAAMECFFNAGQQCNVPSRVLLPTGDDEMLDRIVAGAESMRLGVDDDADMGPLVSEDHFSTVHGYLDEAQRRGARFVTGGQRAEHDDLLGGPFLPPTVVEGAAPGDTIIQEEVFGPVMVIQRYRNLEEAIDLANDGDFGLAAGIFTTDLDAAMVASRQLAAGMVWVNTWNSTVPELPTGGMKQSGTGRELGLEGLDAYLETKTVMIDPARRGP